MAMKRQQRMTPTVWAIFLIYSFITFLIATNFEPLKIKAPVQEHSDDPRTELSAQPYLVDVPNSGGREVVGFTPLRFQKRSDRAHPLLVFFHGAGRSGFRSAHNDTMFTVTADKTGLSVLFPTGAGAQTRYSGHAKWETSPEEMQLFVRTLRAMTERNSIDPARIYLVGADCGGAFALDIAVRMPKLIAGVFSWTSGAGRLPLPADSDAPLPAVMFGIAELDSMAKETQELSKKFAKAGFESSVWNPPHVFANLQPGYFPNNVENHVYGYLRTHVKSKPFASTEAALAYAEQQAKLPI